MDEAFIQYSQHDIDGDKRQYDQKRLVGERFLESSGRSLEAADDGRRHADIGEGLLDGGRRIRERVAGRQIERQGRRGELAGG